MKNQMMVYLLLGWMLTGCTFDTLFDTMLTETEQTPIMPTAISTESVKSDAAADVNCYTPLLLPDRGIQIGSQSIVESPAEWEFATNTELYFDHSKLKPDVTLLPGEILTIIQGPFCFYTRNAQARWWQVRVDSTGVSGYVDEYASSIGVLNIHLSPLTINTQSLEIHYFAVSIADAFGRPARIGETIYISWDIANASDVSVRRTDTGEIIGNGLHNIVEFVVPNIDKGSIDFILIATSADGQQLEETRTLQTDCPDCQPTNDTSIQTNVTAVPVSYIQFERGFMLYRTDTYEIYVLYDDKTVQIFADTWSGETYTDDAPIGYFTPQLGFGNIWMNTAGVRDALGWARSSEIYDASNLLVSSASEVEIHLSNMQILVINNGSWHYKTN